MEEGLDVEVLDEGKTVLLGLVICLAVIPTKE